MAIVERVEGVLKKNSIIYNIIKHQEAYTAQEIAEVMHVPGQDLAKVVMVKAKERYIMTVMPASCRIDFRKLKDVLRETDLRLASEEEFKTVFPDCEAGAEPPFGNLYNIETYVDKSLTEAMKQKERLPLSLIPVVYPEIPEGDLFHAQGRLYHTERYFQWRCTANSATLGLTILS